MSEKRAAAEERDEYSSALCRRTARVKVKSNVISKSFLKTERRMVLGEKEGRIVELAGDKNAGPEAPTRSKGNVRREATAQELMEKSRYVRVIERKEARDDPIKYFLPTWVGSTFWVPDGVTAVKVPHNEESSGRGKNEKESVLLFIGKERTGQSTNIKK